MAAQGGTAVVQEEAHLIYIGAQAAHVSGCVKTTSKGEEARCIYVYVYICIGSACVWRRQDKKKKLSLHNVFFVFLTSVNCIIP